MSRLGKYTRRAFLGLGVAAAGGLAVGYYLYRRPYANPIEAMLAEGEATFNPYIRIAADNTITVYAPRAEMGQGVQTTLAALVAEELDVDLDQIAVEHGPASPAYYNAKLLEDGAPFPFFDDGFMAEAVRTSMGVVSKFLGLQVTGGSSATTDAFVKMRAAGASAREVLKLAAARRWGVEPATLTTARGTITNTGGETLTYGAVAVEAAGLAPPDVDLRARGDWRILGKPADRVEGLAKVTGAPIFGIDVSLPDMLHGTVAMSPRLGAGASRVDTSAALAVPGVRAVVPIETTTGKGFGIVADNTWAAFRGAEALDVTWEDAPYPATSSAMEPLFAAALARDPDAVMGGSGDVDGAFAEAPAGQVITADYGVPFLAHATMEPMNATAQLRDGRLTLWLGTQAPGIVQMACASLLGLEADAVTVHTTHLGGGFGRRAEVDFALYAAALAATTDGRPIKVTWTREEDTRHDTYRPMARAKLRAVVAPGKGAVAVDVAHAAPSIMASIIGRTFPDMPAMGPDKTLLDGLFNQPMVFEHSRFTGHAVDLPVPVGFWRSVGNSQNAFFLESFMDEIAHAAGMDPVAFRLAHMSAPEMAPARLALEKVADMAGWGGTLPPGRAQGVAHVLSFGTWVAQVVQIDASSGDVRIEKVWCAADPGEVLDPRNFEAQMVSGIMFGLSQAIGQEITFEDGVVVQSNFHDFDAIRMAQAPAVEVAILENAPGMGGAGEPGTPPAAPALANAIFAATGKRIRQMPLIHGIGFV